MSTPPTTEEAVALYADLFAHCSEAIHGWAKVEGEWPTREQITTPGNYFEQPASVAAAMGAHKVIDVPGGCFIARYCLALGRSKDGKIKVPLEIYTRSSKSHRDYDELWKDFDQQKAELEIPQSSGIVKKYRLPVHFCFPRFTLARADNYRTLLPPVSMFQPPGYDLAVFMVKWSYLRVEVESGSPYYGTTNGKEIVQEDERPNGSPSSHDISYIRLTTRRGHVIIFRARLHFEGGRWKSWRPSMTSLRTTYDIVSGRTVTVQPIPSIYWDADVKIVRHGPARPSSSSHSLARRFIPQARSPTPNAAF